MKRHKYRVGVLLFIALFSFVGCSNSAAPIEENVTSESVTTSQTVPTISETDSTISEIKTTEAEGYLFETNGISIGIQMEAEPIFTALGEAEAYFETPSCAFLGMDRQYTYGSYMLTTYEEEGQEYIYDIYFLDDKISTPEGIQIGSKIEEVIAAYGEEYTEDFGMYSYVKEQSKLQFLVVDGLVTSVDYTLK